MQILDGLEVYVVEFETVPELPILFDPEKPEELRYALALATAIDNGVITEGGKYGLHVTIAKNEELIFNVYRVE